MSFTDNGSSKISNIFVENASFLRLKNIEIGYTLNDIKKLGMNRMRVYVSGQNLLTWTNYSGLDPESTDLIDMGTYPQSVSLVCGMNIYF